MGPLSSHPQPTNLFVQVSWDILDLCLPDPTGIPILVQAGIFNHSAHLLRLLTIFAFENHISAFGLLRENFYTCTVSVAAGNGQRFFHDASRADIDDLIYFVRNRHEFDIVVGNVARLVLEFGNGFVCNVDGQ